MWVLRRPPPHADAPPPPSGPGALSPLQRTGPLPSSCVAGWIARLV